MSAIWGSVSFTNKISEDLPAKMRSAYADCRINKISDLCCSNIHLAAGIQYITPESSSEQQPIESGDYLFASDCIIDNRKELDTSSSAPDPGLIFDRISHIGFLKTIKMLRGVFSIALYDKSNQTLTLATDPCSCRCLFYYRHSDGITFSTLIEGILSVHPEIRLNPDYLKDFLAAPGLMPNISDSETPYEGVFKVEPGTYICFTKGSTDKHVYFSASNATGISACKTPDEYGQAFRELFETCVSDVLRSSKETGIALSSGFDSSSVGALAADSLAAANKSLFAYTYVPYEAVGAGTRDSSSHQIMDETAPVKDLIAMHPNILPHFLNNGGKNSITGLSENAKIMEIPYKAYGNLPSLCEIYEKAAEDGCRIVLNGQFGNSTVSHGYIDDVLFELFKTGHYIKCYSNLNNYSKYVKESRRNAFINSYYYFKFAKKTESDTAFTYKPSNPFIKENLTDSYAIKERFEAIRIKNTTRIPSSRDFHHFELSYAPMFSYIGEMETKMSLRYGIVLRDPTRDPRMIQFCYNLPYELFAHNGEPRWLIRHNLKDLLPESITADWLRYGVQNSDFLLRIQRDWSSIYAELSSVVSDFKSNKLSGESFAPNIEKMQEFLDNHKDTLPKEDEYLFDNFVFAYILLLFLNSAPGH